jgi:Citrate transporter
VPRALSRIDTEGIIFFLGVLMSIAALDASGILKQLAELLDANIASKEVIATVIGLTSAVIDNVPLVAATMGMYDTAVVPQDSLLWQLIAYCAGTGGSILIIGSAAGVAFMGMESADFVWYVKRVSPWALSGYLAGIGVYVGESVFLPHNAGTMTAVPPSEMAQAPLTLTLPATVDAAVQGAGGALGSLATALHAHALAATPRLSAWADAIGAHLQ